MDYDACPSVAQLCAIYRDQIVVEHIVEGKPEVDRDWFHSVLRPLYAEVKAARDLLTSSFNQGNAVRVYLLQKALLRALQKDRLLYI